MGNVCSAGAGQAPTRQAALGAGIWRSHLGLCTLGQIDIYLFPNFSVAARFLILDFL